MNVEERMTPSMKHQKRIGNGVELKYAISQIVNLNISFISFSLDRILNYSFVYFYFQSVIGSQFLIIFSEPEKYLTV